MPAFGCAALLRTANMISDPMRGVHGALSGSSFNRVWSVIQFTSHVLPPSSENDCSKWGEFVVMFVHTNRMRTTLPFIVSWARNSPRPFLNSPIWGGSRTPILLFAQYRRHWWDWGLYSRKVRPS